MPKFNSGDDLQTHTGQNGGYQFSATRIEDLGASEYTLASIVVDVSGSVSAYERELTESIKSILRACKWSPRADNLLVRVTQFEDNVHEIHGFKLLENCHEKDYDNVLNVRGCTALYDASVNGIDATRLYGRSLFGKDFGVNGIVFVLTDGGDNASTLSAQSVRDAICQTRADESLESLATVLIGVNVSDPSTSKLLKDFHQTAGFTQYVEIGNADAKTLARLADFVSRSISAQSQSLGTGGPSRPLTF